MRKLLSTAVLVGLFAITACTADDDATPGPTPEPAQATSPATEPTVSDEPTTMVDAADPQAAEDRAVEYFTLHNELMKDPHADWQPLLDTTTGEARQYVEDEFEELRQIDAQRVGDAVFHIQDVGEISEADGQPSVVVTACTDSADSDLVLAETGESIMEIEGPLILEQELTLVKEPGGEWLVAIRDNSYAEECTA